MQTKATGNTIHSEAAVPEKIAAQKNLVWISEMLENGDLKLDFRPFWESDQGRHYLAVHRFMVGELNRPHIFERR